MDITDLYPDGFNGSYSYYYDRDEKTGLSWSDLDYYESLNDSSAESDKNEET